LGNRVVVTGIGMVSPVGLDVSSTWQGLISGTSGVDYITRFDPGLIETKIAAEGKKIRPRSVFGPKIVPSHGSFCSICSSGKPSGGGAGKTWE